MADKSPPNLTENVRHLRTVHFSVLIVCFAILVATQAAQKPSVQNARSQLNEIKDIIENGVTRIQATLEESGRKALGLGPALEAGTLLRPPVHVITIPKTYDADLMLNGESEKLNQINAIVSEKYAARAIKIEDPFSFVWHSFELFRKADSKQQTDLRRLSSLCLLDFTYMDAGFPTWADIRVRLDNPNRQSRGKNPSPFSLKQFWDLWDSLDNIVAVKYNDLSAITGTSVLFVYPPAGRFIANLSRSEIDIHTLRDQPGFSQPYLANGCVIDAWQISNALGSLSSPIPRADQYFLMATHPRLQWGSVRRGGGNSFDHAEGREPPVYQILLFPKPQPEMVAFDGRKVLRDSLLGPDRRGLTFEEIFPDLANIAHLTSDLKLDQLDKVLQSEAGRSDEKLELFGAKIPITYLTIWGAVIIVAQQLYFLIHLMHLNGVANKVATEMPDHIHLGRLVWIGIYGALLPRLVTVATVVFLPICLLLYLTVRAHLDINSSTTNIVVDILAAIFGLILGAWTLVALQKLWRRITN